METFEISYDSLQQDEDFLKSPHNEGEPINFNKSLCYKFICYTFQYVDPDLRKYRNKKTYYICQTLRVLTLLLMWIICVINVWEFLKVYNVLVKKISAFNAALALSYHSIRAFRYVILHAISLYLFYAYPHKATEIFDLLSKRCTANIKAFKRIQDQMQNRFRRIKVLIFWSIFCLIGLPIIKKLCPLLIEGITGILWYRNDIAEFKDLVMTSYARFAIVPFVIYLVLVTYLQCILINEYTVSLYEESKSEDEFFQEYLQIHRSIQQTARQYSTYVSTLTLLMFFWGSFAAYTNFSTFKGIAANRTDSSFIYQMFAVLSSFVTIAVEVVFLFTLPWFNLTRVADLQKNLIAKIVEIPHSKLKNKESPFHSLDNLLQFSERVSKHQEHEVVGYTVFGITMTTLRTFWILILGPLGLFIGNAIIKGNL